MSDNRDDLPPEIREALDIIRRTMAERFGAGLDAVTDQDAVRWSILSHAACIERHCIVAEPAVFRALLLRQVHAALADILDVDPRELEMTDDGETVRVDWRDGDREAAPLRPHVH